MTTASTIPARAASDERSPLSAFGDAPHGPEMVIVPAGHFTIGATADDRFAGVLELPRRLVTIGERFAIGRFPVTFAQWDAYAAADPTAHEANDFGFGRGDLPVVGVSWDDATGYCRWLSAQTGRTYRLPGEAEWEYCCRAGTDDVFATGYTIELALANFLSFDFDRGRKPGPGRPTPVGAYPPNAWGLHDFHGNVCELTADGWHDGYATGPDDAAPRPPRDGADPWRVARGGGWDAMPRFLRCAYRDWVSRDARFDNMGFRVAAALADDE